ncbi:MAG: hypothetical protein R8J84_03665, partial [Mariprofundales bacterium]
MALLVTTTSFYLPVADLRSFGIWESALIGWNGIQAQGLDSVLAIWAGSIAGADHALWNLMQQLSQQDVASVWKTVGWALFFIVQAFYLAVVHYAMLGVVAVAEQRNWTNVLLGESKAARWGWGSFYLMVLIWMGATLVFDLRVEPTPVTPIKINLGTAPAQTITIDPCEEAGAKEKARTAASVPLNQELTAEQAKFQKTMDAAIDARVNAAFQPAFRGVDRYLDWYFTMAGEWERLATLVAGDVGA